jgi:hypothetical protein
MDSLHLDLFMAALTVLTTLGGVIGIAWRLRGDMEKRFSGEARIIERQLTEIEGKIALGNQWHALHEIDDSRRFAEVQRQLDEIRNPAGHWPYRRKVGEEP